MMKLKVLVVLTALCLLLSACGNTVVSSQRENSEPEDVLSSAAVQPGELIETYVPEYAKGFSIEYYEGGRKSLILTLKQPPALPLQRSGSFCCRMARQNRWMLNGTRKSRGR